MKNIEIFKCVFCKHECVSSDPVQLQECDEDGKKKWDYKWIRMAVIKNPQWEKIKEG